MLLAGAGPLPFVVSVRVGTVPRPLAAFTTSDAGRECSPTGLTTVTSRSTTSP